MKTKMIVKNGRKGVKIFTKFISLKNLFGDPNYTSLCHDLANQDAEIASEITVGEYKPEILQSKMNKD